MPYSKKYNAFFIHIPKTAGSSIYTLLDLNPQEYSEEAFNTLDRWIPSRQHMTALEIIGRMDSSTWSNSYKFTVVRHPYDRIVSSYEFLKGIIGRTFGFDTFSQFVHLIDSVFTQSRWMESVYFEHFRPQTTYFNFDHVRYDRVLRYERIDDDIELICADLGIPYKKKITYDTLKPKSTRSIASDSISIATEAKNIATETADNVKLLIEEINRLKNEIAMLRISSSDQQKNDNNTIVWQNTLGPKKVLPHVYKHSDCPGYLRYAPYLQDPNIKRIIDKYYMEDFVLLGYDDTILPISIDKQHPQQTYEDDDIIKSIYDQSKPLPTQQTQHPPPQQQQTQHPPSQQQQQKMLLLSCEYNVYN